MTDSNAPETNGCCGAPGSCVFSKPLQARVAVCECAERHTRGERDFIDCVSPVARTNCTTLAALLHERARFALHLPRADQPVIHALAMRLQCGGVLALQHALGAPQPDVHRLVGAAQQRYGSLTDLPWDAIVRELVQWQGRRSRRPAAQ